MAENEDARAAEQIESNGNHEKTLEAPPANEAEPMNQNGGEDKDEKTEPSAELDEVKDEDKPGTDLDTELEAMKKRLLEMEQESFPVNAENNADPNSEGGPTAQSVPKNAATARAADVNQPRSPIGGDDAVADADARSIYVGNVDYSATVEELSKYFEECGTINRVTIITHKPTGTPKGYAYVEFKDQHAVQNALILNEAMFKGRQLKITAKRTNLPGMTRGRGRGRFFRGGRSAYHYGRRPRGRPRGRWVPY